MIPVSERKESNLQVLHDAYKVRKMISDLATNDFYCDLDKEISEYLKLKRVPETRERRKLKAYKRLLNKNRMTYMQIENAFKGWIVSFYKYMSYQQIGNMTRLYYQLFGRIPKWKKHGRLRWLMAQSLKGWDLTGTTLSATQK